MAALGSADRYTDSSARAAEGRAGQSVRTEGADGGSQAARRRGKGILKHLRHRVRCGRGLQNALRFFLGFGGGALAAGAASEWLAPPAAAEGCAPGSRGP